MRKSDFFIFIWLLACAIYFATGGARLSAKVIPLSAQAKTSTANVVPEAPFSVTFIVTANTPPPPDFSKLKDFSVRPSPLPPSAAVPGATVFQYVFFAKHPGDLTIPAIPFHANGETVSTKPIAIHAAWPVATDKMTLAISLSKKVCYANEPIVLTCRWSSRIPFGAIKAVDFDLPALHNSNFQVIAPYAPGMDTQSDVLGIPISGMRILARRGKAADGKQTLTFQRTLIPHVVFGEIAISEAQIVCAVLKNAQANLGFNFPAYFDNSFFSHDLSAGDYKRVYVKSLPLLLTVKPLPQKGRPLLFSGLVGTFAISAKLAQTSCRVGDPITLTVSVSSPKNAGIIRFPSLERQPGFASNFDFSPRQPQPEQTQYAKIYRYTLRPKRAGNLKIAPLTLNYFDAKKGVYKVAKSAPLQLRVLSANDESPANDVAISGNKNGHPFLQCAWLLVLGTIVLLAWFFRSFLAAQLVSVFRRLIPSRAFRQFRKRLLEIARKFANDEAGFYHQLDPLLRDYFSARWQFSPARWTTNELRQFLEPLQLPQETKARILAIQEKCLSYTFAPLMPNASNAKIETDSDLNHFGILKSIRKLDQTTRNRSF